MGMLKNFEDAQSEISDIGIREAFIDGFRLGARLMLAALSEDDGELRPLIYRALNLILKSSQIYYPQDRSANFDY